VYTIIIRGPNWKNNYLILESVNDISFETIFLLKCTHFEIEREYVIFNIIYDQHILKSSKK